jgi:hypothetical protein
MNTQAIVEEMYAIAINTTLDIRDALTAMDKVFNEAITTAKAEALSESASKAIKAYCGRDTDNEAEVCTMIRVAITGGPAIFADHQDR